MFFKLIIQIEYKFNILTVYFLCLLLSLLTIIFLLLLLINFYSTHKT